MGVEHEIHDLKSKRRFELGKAMHLSILDDPHAARAAGPEAFTDHAVQVWRATQGNTDGDWYACEVARRVWRFCELADWQVRLVRDGGDDAAAWEWPVLDTRYDGQPESGGVDRVEV